MKIYLKNNILSKPDILLRKCHKGLNIIDCFKYEGIISSERKYFLKMIYVKMTKNLPIQESFYSFK